MLEHAAIIHDKTGAPVDDTHPLDVRVTGFAAPDIEIGAVEIKDGASDTRVKVAASTAVVAADNAMVVKDAAVGQSTDAAVVTDAAGTVTAYLRGLVARLATLSRGAGAVDATTLRVVSASDGPTTAVLGAVTDAAVITDANGSLSAKLRGLVAILSSVWDSTAAMLKVTSRTRLFAVASAAPLTRPANTTVYSINDAVSDNATAGTVTPLVFTTSDVNNDPIMLRRMRVLTADTGPGVALATFQAFIYRTDPTASAGVVGGDNAAFSTKQGTFVGTMSGTFRPFSDGSAAILTPDDGSEIICNPTTGAKTTYALVKTLTAFTPSANSSVFNFTLEGVQGKA